MKKLFIILISAVLFGACSDELDQQPISSNSTETFFSTTVDFIQGTNAIYADLANYPERILNLSETRSDNIYGVSDGGVRDWEGVNSFWSALSSNIYLSEAWNSNYNGIQRANTVIDQIERRGDIVTDPVLRNRLKAEAKFLRAFFYFDLVRIFGEVPLIDRPLTNEEALTISRSTVSNVYELIISDLTYATDSLLAKYGASDKGRATTYAAKGLLALVHMTRSGPTYDVKGPGLGLNEWNEAETLLDEIIANADYGFLPTCKEIFRYNNEYNSEVIFDVNFLSGQTPIIGNHFPALLVPENWFTALGKPIMGGSNRPLSIDLLSKYDTSDVRLKSFIHEGFTYGDGKVDTTSFYIKYTDSTAVPANINLRTDWPINFIVQRYTDVLLLKAECILNGAAGDQTLVDSLVNRVRHRAGLESLSNVTMVQLMDERRLEFAGEGLRWHDLVRSGLVTSVIPDWIAKEDAIQQMHAFTKEFVVYPIPQAEMDVKVGLYEQTQGYE